jgi:undecaprenyl-diphosphatase
MLAALFNVPANLGYPLLFALVAGESAGALIPGETALIVAAALASRGNLSLPVVLGVAAGAAIIGDNVGYLIGRKGLRWVVSRPGRFAAHRRHLIERGEEFFARWGAAAVFFGRWLPGLRVVTSWLAGANRMPWPRFLFCLRSGEHRFRVAGSDRFHRSRRRRARLPDHVSPAQAAAPAAIEERGRGALRRLSRLDVSVGAIRLGRSFRRGHRPRR